MLAPLVEGLCQSAAPPSSLIRGTRSGNRAKRLRAPAYEHPQRYLIVGNPANANQSSGVAAATTQQRCVRRLVLNVNDHECAPAAGIDWAKDEHALCVLDEAGRKIFEGRFAHEEGGILKLCGSLVERGVERVAIERPEGVLVERVLECGITVLAIHPNQLKASRPRFRASGARSKSDSFDAFCLAELGRTDRHRFRALTPDSDETKALKVLTRAREDLVRSRVALANQLRAELEAFWPGAVLLFSQIDSAISLAFLKRYPSPKDASRLAEKRLENFLSKNCSAGARAPPSC